MNKELIEELIAIRDKAAVSYSVTAFYPDYQKTLQQVADRIDGVVKKLESDLHKDFIDDVVKRGEYAELKDLFHVKH